jgi:hypothetical protein
MSDGKLQCINRDCKTTPLSVSKLRGSKSGIATLPLQKAAMLFTSTFAFSRVEDCHHVSRSDVAVQAGIIKKSIARLFGFCGQVLTDALVLTETITARS